MPALRRAKLLEEVAGLVGQDAVSVVDAGDGWPGRLAVQLDGGTVHVAAHVAPVLGSGRGRDEVERRIENPGQDRPVRHPKGAPPIILGLSTEFAHAVLVAFDAPRRVGVPTRKSMFAPLTLLEEAAAQGWASRRSTSGEDLFAFWPVMLPVYVQQVIAGVEVEAEPMQRVIEAAGLATGLGDAVARARRTSSSLVRDAAFTKLVVGAYDGLCSMCGLDFDMVQAAHIIPVSASDTGGDVVTNGIALCANHHAAFDRHAIWISDNYDLRLSPELHRNADRNEACRSFITTTLSSLSLPTDRRSWPDPRSLQTRYRYFDGRYDWAAPTP